MYNCFPVASKERLHFRMIPFQLEALRTIRPKRLRKAADNVFLRRTSSIDQRDSSQASNKAVPALSAKAHCRLNNVRQQQRQTCRKRNRRIAAETKPYREAPQIKTIPKRTSRTYLQTVVWPLPFVIAARICPPEKFLVLAFIFVIYSRWNHAVRCSFSIDILQISGIKPNRSIP